MEIAYNPTETEIVRHSKRQRSAQIEYPGAENKKRTVLCRSDRSVSTLENILSGKWDKTR